MHKFLLQGVISDMFSEICVKFAALKLYIYIYICDCFQVLQSLYERYRKVINRPDFRQIYQNEPVKHDIVSMLESLCGIGEASTVENVSVLYQFLHPALTECVNLLGMGYN